MSYQVFLSSIGSLFGLYFLVFLGFLSGKFAGVDKTSIARLLIFIISPFVVFHGGLRSQIAPSILVIPLFFLVVPTLLAVIFYSFGGRIWKDDRRNLVALAAGSGNTGYFGIPVMLALFGEHSLEFVVLAVTGIIFYEVLVAYYLAARGKFDVKESIIKVIKLPMIYAFILGLSMRSTGLLENHLYTEFMDKFLHTYSVLGMLLVGLGISGAARQDFDIRFVSLTFAGRFIGWPLLTLAFVLIDSSLLHTLEPAMRLELLVFSFIPLAANSVAFAAQFGIHPEMMSVTVLLSTLVSLVIMPIAKEICSWYW